MFLHNKKECAEARSRAERVAERQWRSSSNDRSEYGDACDIILIRASAHPAGGFLYNRKCNFLYTQKKWLVHTNHFLYKYIPSKLHIRNFLTSYLSTLLGYALDLLVTVSSMCYHTSTSVLSTSSSSRGLTTFVGISHLEGGFTLRCLQRLSRPGLATLLCSWRNNRSTSGQSIPVLSY